jgi:hypothetical protein
MGAERLTLTGTALMWPTPDAGAFNDGQRPDVWEERHERELAKGYNGNGGGTPLAGAVQLWRTPRAPSPAAGGPDVTRLDSPHPYLDLQDQVALWATPTAMDAGGKQGGHGASRTPGAQMTLTGQGQAWMTPTAAMWRSEDGTHSPDHAPPLSRQVLRTPLPGPPSSPSGPTSPPHWPTPTAEDGEVTGHRPGTEGAGTTLTASARSWPTPTSQDAHASGRRSTPTSPPRTPHSHPGTTLTDAVVNGRPDRPKLNPAFVTWLMGWPEGWADAGRSLAPTSFARWATVSCHWLRLLLGSRSLSGQGSTSRGEPDV